jgi:putative inorganic carbon (HCO3(-)) transporter
MSGSRGAYLGLLGGGLTAFTLVGHWLWHTSAQKWISAARKLWLGSCLLAITGVALGISLMPAVRTRVLSIGSLWEDSSIAYRLQVYQTATRMIQDNWLVGIGPGNETFRQIFGAYAPAHLHALGAYSIPLEILVELGALGGLVGVSFLILLSLRNLITLERTPEKNPENPSEALLNLLLLLGGSVAIVAVLANGLFDTVWYRPAVQIPFWLWVAVLVDTSGLVLNPKNGRIAMPPYKNLY